MIASKLPPSRLLGSVAAAVHTKSFMCFVSTARTLIFFGPWETAVYRGDPAVSTSVKMLAKAFYKSDAERQVIHQLHDKLVAELDALGESGRELGEAVASVLMRWKAERVISEFKF